MSKRYYATEKDYYRRRRLRPLFHLIKWIVSMKFERDEFVWLCDKPTEPVFYVSNHTKVHAPIMMILSNEPKARLWANCYFISYKSYYGHMIKKVLKDRPMLKPLGILLSPLVIDAFRGIEPIPVYHDINVKITFDKSLETMQNGMNMVVFPERTENRVNDYLWDFNRGFVTVGEYYYRHTGKLLKFYPMYCCPELHKYLVGEPITFNPDSPPKLERERVCLYLQDKIREMADSLPPHTPEIYK